jgi:alkaline phosphatase D
MSSELLQVLGRSTTRREFLAVTGGFLALGVIPGCRGDARTRFRAYPFALGVASGDPAPDGVVLWTRLLDDAPLTAPVSVRWELARDEAFRQIERQGDLMAVPELAHSVHVEVDGLEPDRVYHYRFVAGDDVSPPGRTRTAPLPGAAIDDLRFAFCSCQNWQQGLYTAFRHMAAEDARFVVHLGDYIYEGGVSRQSVRPHDGPELLTLEQYRSRYALYKSDADLQAAHAAFPFIVTWDDHEVDNNYAGGIAEDGMDPAAFLLRRAAAYQAFYEHQPLRRAAMPRGPDMQLYRRLQYGSLIDLHVLDTRQYRTDQACGDGMRVDCAEAASASATLMGSAQERWLHDGLAASRARWNVLGTQVPIAPSARRRGDAMAQDMDKWSGYAAERDRLIAFLREQHVSNPVSIVGDVHVNWLAQLKMRWDDPASPDVGVEFVGTSISSGGDGRDAADSPMLRDNPHVRFYNGQRGYVRCRVTPDRWTADYRIVPWVTRPDAPIETRASFVVENGRPVAEPA